MQLTILTIGIFGFDQASSAQVEAEKLRSSRLALHLLTRDFPRPECLIDMVAPNEALITWMESEDGRLIAVLIFRERLSVRADELGRPLPDPAETVPVNESKQKEKK